MEDKWEFEWWDLGFKTPENTCEFCLSHTDHWYHEEECRHLKKIVNTHGKTIRTEREKKPNSWLSSM